MQSSAPELMDLSKESKKTLDMYGAEPGKPSYANNCLLARRLIERGVRFVQLFHEAWDHHGGLVNGLKTECKKTDQASAALVKDLKQRGLLDDTLVIWGGEFGRTPMVQGGDDGRDHHPNCLHGLDGRRRREAGSRHGASRTTLGFNAVEDRVHVHDLNATILHLLGIDHTKLTFRIRRAATSASPTSTAKWSRSCWREHIRSKQKRGGPSERPFPPIRPRDSARINSHDQLYHPQPRRP